MNLKPQEAIVTISYVQESPTKGGLRRFVIGADRTPTGDTLLETRLSFTTLNQWKASLCEQHKKSGVPLTVKFRDTGFFDFDLLWVGVVQEQEPDGDPERDRAAQAALEYWQRGPKDAA